MSGLVQGQSSQVNICARSKLYGCIKVSAMSKCMDEGQGKVIVYIVKVNAMSKFMVHC